MTRTTILFALLFFQVKPLEQMAKEHNFLLELCRFQTAEGLTIPRVAPDDYLLCFENAGKNRCWSKAQLLKMKP